MRCTTSSFTKPKGPFSSKYDWAWKVLEFNADMDAFMLFSLYVDDEALIDTFGSFSVNELTEIVNDFRESYND